MSQIQNYSEDGIQPFSPAQILTFDWATLDNQHPSNTTECLITTNCQIDAQNNQFQEQNQSQDPAISGSFCLFEEDSDQNIFLPTTNENLAPMQTQTPTQTPNNEKTTTESTAGSMENFQVWGYESTTLSENQGQGGITKISEEEENKKFKNQQLLRQAIIAHIFKNNAEKRDQLENTQNYKCNIEAAIQKLNEQDRLKLYLIQTNQIIFELIKTLYPLAVYWVEIVIKKQNDLSKVMKELQINDIQKVVYLEKLFLSWDASSSKIYKKFLQKEDKNKQQKLQEKSHIVKMTIQEEKNIEQELKQIIKFFQQCNQKFLKPRSLAKNCNRNIGDFFGVIVVERIHLVYIREPGLTKKQREAKFRQNYPDLHQKIESLRRSKSNLVNRGFQMQALKKILCLNEIPEPYWREILNELEIYREINESKIRHKPFLKKFYYCFVPRLMQIRRRRETSKHPWLFNGRKDRSDAEWLQRKERECSLETALIYEEAWSRGETIAENVEFLNVEMNDLVLEEVESESDEQV